MKMRFPILLIFIALFALSACSQSTVHVIVYPPPTTPAGSTLFIAGDRPDLGNWDPGRVAMQKREDSCWHFTLQVPAGTELQFKITRGNWNAQAVYEKGIIPANTSIRVLGDRTVELRPITWSDKVEGIAGGINGTAKFHRAVAGSGLNYSRDLIVWLPPSYEKDNKRRFPVLYMHDGQNVFDPSTSFIGFDWHADEVADSLITAGAMQEIIIVGIANSPDRMPEYSDTELGRAYARFVVYQVKPLIDSVYRTLPDQKNTAVMGSSMGGLISFLFTWWYPDVFGKAGCLSSVFDDRASSLLSAVEKYDGPRKNVRWYLDCGGFGGEASLRPGMDEMASRLLEKGYVEGKDFVRYFDPQADHSERAWAGRLWRPLTFLFGTHQ